MVKVLHYMLQLNTVHVNVTVSCMIKLHVERHGKGITLHVTIEHCACSCDCELYDKVTCRETWQKVLYYK